MRSLDPRKRSSEAVTPPTCTRAAAAPRAGLGRGRGAVLALCAAFGLGGCSVSYPLFGDDDIKTGSIARPEAPQAVPQDKVTRAPLAPPPGSEAARPSQDSAAPSAYAAPQPSAPVGETASALSPADWTYARGALGLAMGAASPNASVPWANPDSGAYGSFTASAAATTDNGALCRPFAASYSMAGREQRLEGAACRTAAGYWEAVSIRSTRAGA